MTYWLVGEEPWRTRHGRLSTIEPETSIVSQAPVADPVAHDIPRMLDNVQQPSEMDAIDTSPNTWLLADCPAIPEGDRPTEYDSKIQQLSSRVDMNFEDRSNGSVNHYQSPNSLIRQQSARDKSCKTCQIQGNNSKRERLMSPRYSSAPIITANSSYRRDSSPTVPLRTTSPQSCI